MSTAASASKPTVVIGTIGSDAHVVGVTLLEHALKEAGFEVHNLGAQTPEADFVETADREGADAVLVSSLYGHAERDCATLHEAFSAAGLDPTTYVGGNLAVGQTDFETVRRRFRELGFDRVFDAEAGFEEVVEALRRDLGHDERVAPAERESARVRS